MENPEKKGKNQILIIAPQICPVCGDKEVAGEFKLNSSGIRNQKTFVNLLMCKEHIKWDDKSKNRRVTSTFFISFFTLIFLVFVSSAFFNNTIALIISLMGLIIILPSWLYYAFRITNYTNIVKDHIIFQYSLPESIISIKRSDWAIEFQNLNQCKEYIFDYELAKEYEKKWVHNTYQMIKFVVIFSVMIVVFLISSSMVQDGTLKTLMFIFLYLSYFMGIGSVIYFGVKIIYYHLKEEQIKNSEKENYTRKNCIVILIIIIAIPSVIWIIGSLIEYFLMK